MSLDVEFIAANASVQDAAQLMGELDVGGLPVGGVDAVVGVITDRDILFRVVAKGLDPVQTRVRDIASRPVLFCRTTDRLPAVLDQMAANHVRRLPVRVGDDGAVVGWVTLSDVSRRLLVGSAALQSALREMTEPG